MEGRPIVGHRPLNRNRNIPPLWQYPQKHGRFDIVVIGQRDHRLESEHVLDLFAFDFKRRQR